MIIVLRTEHEGQEPETPTTPTNPPRLSLGVTLVGVDGSTWDLISGPVRLISGARGFAVDDPEHWYKESPALAGSAWQGLRQPRTEVFLPVYIAARESLQWRNIDAAFFAALDPAGECELIVSTPDARSRRLPIRFAGGANGTYEFDPVLMRYASYGLTFVAADPYWQTDPVVEVYSVSEPVDLFPGPPFGINAGQAVGSGSVTNPGQLPAWPRWVVSGPFSEATVGVGDSVVTIAASVGEGESITVDMDPRRRTITDQDGEDVWTSATDASFTAIPPGSDVPLSLDIQDPGDGTTIELSFTPRYRRAW